MPDYDEIKRKLKASGSSLRAMSRELGVSHTIVVHVAKGERTSARVACALLKHLSPMETREGPK